MDNDEQELSYRPVRGCCVCCVESSIYLVSRVNQGFHRYSAGSVRCFLARLRRSPVLLTARSFRGKSIPIIETFPPTLVLGNTLGTLSCPFPGTRRTKSEPYALTCSWIGWIVRIMENLFEPPGCRSSDGVYVRCCYTRTDVSGFT